jgi:AraC-like DNA-binding protein
MFVGTDLVAERHSHSTASLVISLDGPFRARLEEGEWTEHDALLASPEAVKEVDGRGRTLAVLLIDPETQSYQRLSHWFETGARYGALPAAALERLRRQALRLLEKNPDRFWRNAIRGLARPGAAARPRDPRISDALQLIRRRMPAKPTVADLAEAVGLSEGRLIHLFREQMGFSLGKYTQWLRVRDAMLSIAAGGNMTDAALDAGFADSAHLSRVFRAMFGVPPSAVLRPSRVLSIVVRPPLDEEITAPYQQTDVDRWMNAIETRNELADDPPSGRYSRAARVSRSVGAMRV